MEDAVNFTEDKFFAILNYLNQGLAMRKVLQVHHNTQGSKDIAWEWSLFVRDVPAQKVRRFSPTPPYERGESRTLDGYHVIYAMVCSC